MSPDHSADTVSHISANTPIAPAVNTWRYYLEDQGKSPHTIKAFIADVLMLASYLPPDRPLGDISTHEINNFLDWMQKSRGVPCSPKTLARRITSLKSFFRWLQQYGVILIDPAERVVQQSVISPIPQVLSPAEIEAVLEAGKRFQLRQQSDTRYLVLVQLLLETGIKKNECLGLSPNHIDTDTPGEPILFIRYTSPQHRYKERKIPISEEWMQIYQQYQAQFPTGERLFPWSQRRLEYLLEDLGTEAGLDKHLSFDMCRWTCALTDWQAWMEPNKIRQKLGVSKIQWREVKMKLEQLAGGAA
jgi:site-specific recombinase XerD